MDESIEEEFGKNFIFESFKGKTDKQSWAEFERFSLYRDIS